MSEILKSEMPKKVPETFEIIVYLDFLGRET